MRAIAGVLTAVLVASVPTSRPAAQQRQTRVRPAQVVLVKATAYCRSGTTRSGVRTRTGIIAADPRVLPVGSVVRIIDGTASGIYTVMDTGRAIKDREIDIFIPDCERAKKFGEQNVRVRVLRHGQDPKANSRGTP
jgi:3D (Asp-Asp-Asp) domain-containing protein